MKYKKDIVKNAVMTEAVERVGKKIFNSYSFFTDGIDYWGSYGLWERFQRFVGYHFTMELLKISMDIIDLDIKETEIKNLFNISKFSNHNPDDYVLENIYPEIAEYFYKKFDKKITRFLFDYISGHTCYVMTEDAWTVKDFCKLEESNHKGITKVSIDYLMLYDLSFNKIKTLSELIVSTK